MTTIPRMPQGRARTATPIRVIVETGTTRVFASAADWPGWARGARDEEAALATLLAYAPRYGSVVSRTGLGFVAPVDATSLRVDQRVRGNATTDFGAPGVPARSDVAAIGDPELARLRTLLAAGWQAFDAGVEGARGKVLRPGPRGGGRTLTAMIKHVRDAEALYVSALGWPFKTSETGRARLEATRAAVLEGLAASARGEIAPKGPRGGIRWKPRFFARRLVWHALDHLWEIEDRSA